jgi:PRC-barrel domain
MMQNYDGAEVVDAPGERIGTVERCYVDDSGIVRFVAVMIGAYFPKHRLIPVAGVQFTSGALVVPYTRDRIVESPDASSASDILEGELLKQVQAYYALGRESTDVETAGSTEEDVTMVPGEVVRPEPGTEMIQWVVEEEVMVRKRRVVTEVLHVRTGQVTEHQTTPERVEVIQDGDIVVRGE